jgi:GNAT superfamily N-acetyltransferase
MKINIRKAVTSDAAPIAALLHDLGWFKALEGEALAVTQARIIEHLALCHADDSHTVYIAEGERGDFLGYSAVHWLPFLFLTGPEGHVSELFITEAARGKGVGTRLLENVIAAARTRGCARLSLVNSRHRQSYLRDFYKKHGWQEREQVANFIFDLTAPKD